MNHLTVNKQTSGSTQTQVLNATVFVYREALKVDVGDLYYLHNVRIFKNFQTIMSKADIIQLCINMYGTTILMAGLRINEWITLEFRILIEI